MHDWMAPPSLALWLRRFLVLMLLGCVGWGGALGQEDDDDRRGVQDFSLSVSPSTGSVVQGSSRTYTVELSSIDSDGIDDEISLTISGLRTGLTETFSGSLSSSDTSTTLTIRASTSAAVGSGSFTVTGTADSGLTRTASASVTVTARQPTSFSITPSTVRLLESYTFRVGNAANMTLDLQYSLNGGATQTITGWPTLNSSGTASARPTLASQVGNYVFTAYRNTQASTWLSSNVSLRVLPALNPDFDLTVSPGSKKVYRGTSGTYAVRLDSIDEFSSPVTLRVSGLPSGVGHSFPSTSVTPTGSSTLTIDVGSSVSPGRYRFTVTGTGGGKTHTATAEVVVPDFTLSISPQRVNADRGSSRTFRVTITPQHGFSIPVTLSVSDLGTGLSGTLSRTSVTPTGTTTVTLTIRISCTAPRGAGTFTVRVTDGRVTKSVTGTVDVKGFSVSNSPEVRNLQRPGSVDYTVDVDLDSGFLASVRLSISGLPSEVMHSFSPNPTRSTSRLRLTAGPTAPPGRHTFTVTGTAHGCTDDDSDDVIIVDPPPDPEFELSMTPESGDVDRGSSRTYTVTVDPDPGFTSDVDLSVSGLRPGLTWSFSTDPVTSSDWTSRLTLDTDCNASLGSDLFKVTGTGGNASDSDTDTVVVKGFSLSPPPVSVQLERGTSEGYTITVNPDSGFSSDVRLSVSGLPSGVRGSFSPTSTGSTSTLTLEADATATLGPDSFTVTGTAHGCAQSISVPIEITGSLFQMRMTPESANLQLGATVEYEVAVSPAPGFSSNVTLSVSDLPPGVTWIFSPNPVNASSATPWTSILTLTTSPNAATSPANFTVTGTSGDFSASDTDTVVVTSTPICALTLDSQSVSVAAGSPGTLGVSVALTTVFGSSASFDLGVSGLPAGVTGIFVPVQVTTGGSDNESTLTLTATSAAPAGTGDFIITASGTSGGCTATGMIQVIGSSGFSLSPDPLMVSVAPGASQTSLVTVSAVGTFSSAVALAASGLPAGVMGTFAPPSVTPTAMDPTPTSTLTLDASASATPGTYSFTITGTAGALTQEILATVVVSEPEQTGSFTLSVTPARRGITKGDRGGFRVTVDRTDGFSAPVTLSVSGLSNKNTPSFSVNPVPESTARPQLTIVVGKNASSGDDEFTITGTAGTRTQSVTATVDVAAPGNRDFTLEVSPKRRLIDPGSSHTYAVSVPPIRGLSTPVELSIRDLAPGFTSRFSNSSISIGGSSKLTISAPDPAPPGEETFVIQGIAQFGSGFGAQTVRRATTAVAEIPSPDFTLSVDPPTSRTIARNQSLAYNLNVTRLGSLTSPIALSVIGLESDSGLTPTFSDDSLQGDGEPSSVLTIAAGSNAVAGTDDFVIVAKSEDGSLIRTASQSVTVTGPDFSLEVLPWSKNVARAPPANPTTGEDGTCSRPENANPTKGVACARTFVVKVHQKNEFAMPQGGRAITLTLSSLLPGLSGSFSSSTVTPSILSPTPTSTLTIKANSTATLGYHQFTITGTGQYTDANNTAVTLTRTTTARVEVFIGRECRCADPWDGNQ